ncbi:MAG: dihydrodipicolinate synthase family protein [Thermoleophilia bacterium]|nr:dihydrodipicolinate synthase family protein [Thermoleophilia bacterium]
MLRGALAAAVTPLRAAGAALDEEAFGPYVDFLVAGGLDGVLALGTTGEGILLSEAERRRAAELFVDAAGGRMAVAVHCGAQTTRETAALAEHAAGVGADAVAVIGPPYYALDEDALLAHFAAAARACEPLPFYLYEFRARSGYSIPPALIERLRERSPNLRGLKVSNQPWDAVAPYLVEGLDLFVGAESLIVRGLEAGAAGAVSGLAAAFPELVARVVHEGAGDVGETRATLERFPFQAAIKVVLAWHTLPVQHDVRAPLRGLTADERAELEAWLASS